MLKRVFISYRRNDTAPAAGRVYDRISKIISEPNVFFDVNNIRGGEDFENRIVNEIKKSDAVLVFIGKKWLEPAQPGGKGRIWEPDDYVRVEVRTALACNILMLPILVDGAQMPKPDWLPGDVQAIATKNALPLRHETFDDDTQNVVATVLGLPGREKLWDDKGKIWVKLGHALGGVIAASLVLIVAAVGHFLVQGRPISASIGSLATISLIFLTVIVGLFMGLRFEVRKRSTRLRARI